MVILVIDKIKKSYLVHRLVALAFIPNPKNKPQINHKNAIRSDNRIENIEWVTPKENIAHAIKNGLMDWTRPAYGEKHGRHKLTEKDVINIKKEILINAATDRQLAEIYNVSHTAIYLIRKSINWKHVLI